MTDHTWACSRRPSAGDAAEPRTRSASATTRPLCAVVLAVPATAASRSTAAGWRTAQLVGLLGSHREADRQCDAVDAERLGEEAVLRGHVVADRDLGEIGPPSGGGAFEGEVEKPLPSWPGQITK